MLPGLIRSKKENMMNNTKYEFTFVYDGEALRDHSMDVKQLAPALLSMGNLLELVNQSVNEGRTKLDTRVKADFAKGSFDIKLIVDVNELVQQTMSMIQIYGAKEIAIFIGLIYGTIIPIGLIQLLISTISS